MHAFNEHIVDFSITKFTANINICKRTQGLIICSTWFDFFRQLVTEN